MNDVDGAGQPVADERSAGGIKTGAAGGPERASAARQQKLGAHEDDAPKATDAQRSWREIMAAAALQGATFALVKAIVGRAAEGTRKLTGIWPGEGGQQPGKEA